MSRLNIAISAIFAGVVLTFSSCDKGIDPAEQLAIDVKKIDDHLAASSITAYKDITGLRFSITTLGDGGFPPQETQQVTVKYSGRLLDGTEFDSGTTQPTFVSGFILGWRRGLPLLPKGTKATLYVPSGMAYGEQGYGSIPGNSVLVFDVELQDVVIPAAERLRLQSDITAIDNYLAANSIVANADTTGVRYVITQQGTGEFPSWYSKVRFSYVGKLMSNGEHFASGETEPSFATDSRVVDYIHGIKLALTKLAVGSKGTFYIPSGLAFGPSGTSTASVPANANVIYELELLGIVPEE